MYILHLAQKTDGENYKVILFLQFGTIILIRITDIEVPDTCVRAFLLSSDRRNDGQTNIIRTLLQFPFDCFALVTIAEMSLLLLPVQLH